MNGKRHELWAALFRAKACAYVHVPKAGGTSVEATLFGVRKQTQHSSLGEWDALLESDGGVGPLFKFAFVRHPLQRFLSAFAYIISRDKQAEPDGEAIQTVHFASLLIRRRFARTTSASTRRRRSRTSAARPSSPTTQRSSPTRSSSRSSSTSTRATSSSSTTSERRCEANTCDLIRPCTATNTASAITWARVFETVPAASWTYDRPGVARSAITNENG